jgi:hypothetical protein
LTYPDMFTLYASKRVVRTWTLPSNFRRDNSIRAIARL